MELMTVNNKVDKHKKYKDPYRILITKEDLVIETKYKKAFIVSGSIIIEQFIYLRPDKKNPDLLFTYIKLKAKESKERNELSTNSYENLFSGKSIVYGGYIEDNTLREIIGKKSLLKSGAFNSFLETLKLTGFS